MLLFLLSPALAWDRCVEFDTPWEALDTWRHLEMPSQAAYDALVMLEVAGCATEVGGVTEWSCSVAADGTDATGTRTRTDVPRSESYCRETLTSWDGIVLGIDDGDALSVAFDATLNDVMCLDDSPYGTESELLTESGVVTWVDGTTDAWSLTREGTFENPRSGPYMDRITLDYTLGTCTIEGWYGYQFDGLDIARSADLQSGGHRLRMGAESGDCNGSYYYVIVAPGNPYGFDYFETGLWDGEPFSSVEPTDDDPDLDGDMFTATAGDCDEGADWVHVCAIECINGVDDDCDGTIDEGDRGYSVDCPDTDQDGDGVVYASDCDDLDPSVGADCPDDTGEPDTGEPDTGEPDTGDTEDTDTGAPDDTGPDEETATSDTDDTADTGDAGCAGGCATPGTPSGWAPPGLAGLLALALLRRRGR